MQRALGAPRLPRNAAFAFQYWPNMRLTKSLPNESPFPEGTSPVAYLYALLAEMNAATSVARFPSHPPFRAIRIDWHVCERSKRAMSRLRRRRCQSWCTASCLNGLLVIDTVHSGSLAIHRPVGDRDVPLRRAYRIELVIQQMHSRSASMPLQSYPCRAGETSKRGQRPSRDKTITSIRTQACSAAPFRPWIGSLRRMRRYKPFNLSMSSPRRKPA